MLFDFEADGFGTMWIPRSLVLARIEVFLYRLPDARFASNTVSGETYRADVKRLVGNGVRVKEAFNPFRFREPGQGISFAKCQDLIEATLRRHYPLLQVKRYRTVEVGREEQTAMQTAGINGLDDNEA